MIRIAARKKDINNAISFAEKLQKKTGLLTSLNVIKMTNFSVNELVNVCKKISKSKIKYIYFADTHGNLNLPKDKKKYLKAIKILQNKKKHVGLHLHDHSGYGVMNHMYLKNLNVKLSDTSIKGMGKGYGNLKLEHVIELRNLPKVINLINKYQRLWIQNNDLYSVITGAYSISDGYASLGKKKKYSILKFSKICSKIRGTDKDTVNSKLLQSEKFIKVSQKLFLFDLDGVLIDSLPNMKVAWKSSCKKYNVKVDFAKFYRNLGMGFYESLDKLKIYENQNFFINNYKKVSSKNIHKIEIFKYAKTTLKKLGLKHKLGIVTSKDLTRTKKILKIFNLKFDIISCPKKNLKPKPFPDQILFCTNKLKFSPQNTFFIGDTSYDFNAAKAANVNFIFAKYGYGKINKKYKNKIKNLKEIIKYS